MNFDLGVITWIGLPSLFFVSFMIFVVKRYKRCPSNQILVVYGKVSGKRAAHCIHGGAAFILPLIQDFEFLSLKPITIEINLTGALSKNNIRVNVPSTFTIGISTVEDIMANAAERMLGLTEKQISTQANDIIVGQLRLVVATLSIEEINQDREKFLSLINQNVGIELNKIGLEVINVNITDITDESGYIKAIGQKAAATAINKAKVEVAEQEKEGAIGEATANRQRHVEVAEQEAQSVTGIKKAEKEKRIAISKYEAEGVAGEASAEREKEIALAEQQSKQEQGKKQAELEQRIKIAELEAKAVQGENESKVLIANSNASLVERKAEATRRAEVANANSSRDIFLAGKEQEIARLEKEELAQQEIEKRKMEINAEADAERSRRIAKGEADAILLKYQAQAEGVKKLLEAKAKGYESLINACGGNSQLAPTFLMVEQMPALVKEQVKAISNLKIDKITVWDNGHSNSETSKGTTSNFLSSLISSLPAWHELANQAGIELPPVLGSLLKEKVSDTKPKTVTSPASKEKTSHTST
ncbi:MAG: flotillin family protein [Desulfobacterales bacterium]|nr:flotillin family protein [Desulfobacterales bacterium]